ncbi:MAG: hypothetical protein IID54_06865 [Proteobacteria bacterium]|nr:hypothetical protein [Pseudomonadota bacterium]
MNNMIINEIAWYKNPKICKAASGLNLTGQQLLDRVKQEANGNAVWANWVPGVLTSLDSLGVLPKGSGNLRIEIDAAITADFIPTP